MQIDPNARAEWRNYTAEYDASHLPPMSWPRRMWDRYGYPVRVVLGWLTPRFVRRWLDRKYSVAYWIKNMCEVTVCDEDGTETRPLNMVCPNRRRHFIIEHKHDASP